MLCSVYQNGSFILDTLESRFSEVFGTQLKIHFNEFLHYIHSNFYYKTSHEIGTLL